TEKLKPLFIHKYENPWAFKHINKKTPPVDYYWNLKTTQVTNITIEFLSPNITAHLQPCNQGIINNFKAQYRKLFLNNRVKAFDKYNEYGIKPVEINIKKCIKYVACAWNNVTESTIKNSLIDKLNLENSLSTNEFIHYDSTVIIIEIRTNDEILAAIISNKKDEIEEDSDPSPIITHNEAIESYDKIIWYLE
ncbi:8433_t:CDS:2, partial [Diversispora eburnea]